MYLNIVLDTRKLSYHSLSVNAVSTTWNSWGDASDQNWKYRFTQRDLSAVSNGVISCHIKRWSAVSSLPRRHLEYFAVRSVSSLLAAYKNILSCNLMRLKIGLQLRQIWKGFALLTCAINDNVSSHAPDKYRYVVSSSIYRGRPGQLCRVSPMNFDLKRFTSAGW